MTSNATKISCNYQIPFGNVNVKVVELDKHKFIVASACGEKGIGYQSGCGAAISIIHSPSCQCNANTNAPMVSSSISNQMNNKN